jgi:hypothetical protein
MKRKTLAALLRNNFENAAGIGHVHETFRAEHQTEQTAVAATIGNALSSKLGEIGPVRTSRRIRPKLKSANNRLLR